MIETERMVPPKLQEVQLRFPDYRQFTMDNGIPVYMMNAGEQEVVKLELVFRAGKWEEPKRVVSFMTGNLLKEGTNKASSHQISEKLDFLGANMKVTVGPDLSSVVIQCLNKHLEQVLILLLDILLDAEFPEKELELQKTIITQRLAINREKLEFIAHRKLFEAIFGPEHPYGYDAQTEDYEAVQREDLLDFFHKKYTADKCQIFISGKILPEAEKMLIKYLGHHYNKRSVEDIGIESIPAPVTQKKLYLDKPGSSQAAVRIGKIVPNKTDPEYMKLQVLNTIFGGYFGSRLMSNIREEKGYTYGIYSALNSFLHSGAWYITSEVGSKVCKSALKEIYYEIERLQQEPVPAEELKLVRNYSLGSLLSAVDGPFSATNVLKSLVIYGLDADYFNRYVATIKEVTAQELQDMAQKFLDRNSLWEVVAGCNE